MATKDLDKIVGGLEVSIAEYNNMGLPNDMSKAEALNIISKEVSLVSTVEKRKHETHIQDEELQEKKDHRIFTEHQDEKRFELEKSKTNHDNSIQDQELNIKRKDQELRQAQFDADQRELVLKHESEKRDFWFKVAMFATTSITTLLGIIVPCVMYKSLAKTSMRYSWQYDGRTPSEFNEFMRGVKPRV